MVDVKANIEEFENIFTTFIKRDGVDDLLKFIRRSDFYTAPASTRYHLSEEGGLLQHSLNVYYCLSQKRRNPIWDEYFAGVSDETIAIIALLHDLCKTYFYEKEMKNQKVYDKAALVVLEPWQIKHDSKGDFAWMEVPTYVVNNKYPMGHGAKSIFIIQHYIKLTEIEMMCIYWHMGAYGLNDKQCNELGEAIEKYPLILALQEADMEASHLMEVKQS